MSLYFLHCSWSWSLLLLLFHGVIIIQSHGFLEINNNLNIQNNNNINPQNIQQQTMSMLLTSSTTVPPQPISTFSTPTQPPPPPPQLNMESPRIQCTEMKSSNLGEGQIMATEMCPAKIKHMIGKSVTDLRCQPRPEIVKLQLPGPNFDLHPSVAEVKRCNGFCGTPTSCLPTKISIKQVPVFTIDKARLHMFAQECAMVELEEHEECRCTCAIKASHCGPNQKYERGNCACVCMNHEVREECERNSEKGIPHQWDPITCSCRTVQESMECASGLMWVTSISSSPLTLLQLPLTSTEVSPTTFNNTRLVIKSRNSTIPPTTTTTTTVRSA